MSVCTLRSICGEAAPSNACALPTARPVVLGTVVLSAWFLFPQLADLGILVANTRRILGVGY